jgi:hypothetical protein
MNAGVPSGIVAYERSAPPADPGKVAAVLLDVLQVHTRQPAAASSDSQTRGVKTTSSQRRTKKIQQRSSSADELTAARMSTQARIDELHYRAYPLR